MKKSSLIFSVVLIMFFFIAAPSSGQQSVPTSKGQTILVSAGYHEYFYPIGISTVYQYSTTKLCIRNSDPNYGITLTSVDLYDFDGVFVKEYLTTSEIMAPWTSRTFSASSNANVGREPYDRDAGRLMFVVKWQSNTRVLAPLVGAGQVYIRLVDVSGNFEILGALSMEGKVIEERK